MILCDTHIHTTYCDGKSTVDEIIAKAGEMGITSLGFSGHGYTDFDTSYCMSKEDTKKYIDDILRAKKSAPFEVYLGIEKDILSDLDTEPFDYAIGSCHYVKKDGQYLEIDSSKTFDKIIERFYGGDALNFAKDYYMTICEHLPKANADITGHIDLISKFNEDKRYFSDSSPKYREYALTALETAKGTCPLIEMNTGAISRGYRKDPYPAPFMLDYIKEHNMKIIINSDSHNADTLCFGMKDCIEILKHKGFKSRVILKNSKFTEIGL